MAEGEKENYFKWRGDPEKNFSDWKIEIVTDKMSEDEINEIEKYYSIYLAENIRSMQRSSSSHQSTTTTTTAGFDGNSTKIIRTFFVHRVTLGYGGRKCSYFEKQFHHAKEGNFVNNNNNNNVGTTEIGKGKELQSSSISSKNTSRIELPPLAAATFPLFLDYIYDPRLTLNDTTDIFIYLNCRSYDIFTVVCLCFLVDYFGNSDREAYDVFFKRLERNSVKGSEYSKLFAFTKALGLHHLLAEHIGDFMIESFNLNWDLIPTAGIGEFWMDVASYIWIDLGLEFRTYPFSSQEYKSARWSQIIYELSKCHSAELTYEMFVHLTSVDILPVIHPDVAEPLIELESKLKAKRRRTVSDVDRKMKTDGMENTSIKDRTILVLVCDECKGMIQYDGMILWYGCNRCRYISKRESQK